MPIDANIALAAGQPTQPGVDPRTFFTLLDLQQRMQLQNQQLQAQNALRGVLAQPGAIDEKTGMPTPNALRSLYAAGAPSAAMTLQQNMLRFADQRTQQQWNRAKLNEAGEAKRAEIAKGGIAIYDDTLKTQGPRAAQEKLQQYYDEQLPAYQQLVGPDVPVMPNADINRLRQLAMARDVATAKPMTPYQQVELGFKEQQLARQEAATTSRMQHERTQEDVEREKFRAEYGYYPGQQGQGATAAGGAAPEAGQPLGDVTKTGEEYLKTLPPEEGRLVELYAKADAPFPGGWTMRNPRMQRILAEAKQFDPGISGIDYPTRLAARKDFTSGKSAQNLTSINMTIGHMGELLDSGRELNNFRESMLPYVRTANELRAWMLENKGDPRITRYNEARDAVARELERVFRGTGGSVTGIEEWKKTLSAANSPEQMEQGVKTGVNLLNSRIDSVYETYKRGLGTLHSPFDLLTPKAKETLAKLPGGEDVRYDEATRPGTAPAAAPTAAPSQGAPLATLPPALLQKMRPGQEYHLNDGSTWVWRQGAAAPERVSGGP